MENEYTQEELLAKLKASSDEKKATVGKLDYETVKIVEKFHTSGELLDKLLKQPVEVRYAIYLQLMVEFDYDNVPDLEGIL